ncbi:TPA: hypothetical protein ACQJWR_002247 [Raoultella ornithinolytica]|uniref:hypothetical protein n=1 Tax=Raoultella ornithinolytica TaxID=54291 RepID=UPI000AD63B53|nr:hypothetical protein [Raoultella ornithinolytica]
MTDITELAQREKFEAWFVNDVVGDDVNFPVFKDGEYTEGEIYDEQLYFMLQAMWMAWKAAGAELVEALEKAQAKNALVAGGIEATAKLHERIAELESRTVTIKLSKDHVDDADLFGWGVIVVPLEALKEACADAGVSVEITAAGGKVEAE